MISEATSKNQESALELRYSGYGEILTAFIPAEDATWVELLKKFTDFLRGAGFNIDQNVLDGVGLPGEIVAPDTSEVEESKNFLTQVVNLRYLLYEKLPAMESEQVAARLVSLADSGYRVVELQIPASMQTDRSALWPTGIFDYVDKINIKHGKADTKIKFILELG